METKTSFLYFYIDEKTHSKMRMQNRDGDYIAHR